MEGASKRPQRIWLPGITPVRPVMMTFPVRVIDCPVARVTSGKLPTRVSASESVVTGELVASDPSENQASPFVVTQLVTGTGFALNFVSAKRRKASWRSGTYAISVLAPTAKETKRSNEPKE